MKRILFLLFCLLIVKAKAQTWQLMDTAGFTPVGCEYPNINIIAGVPYIGFDRGGNPASAMKFNGTHWVYVGNPDFTPGQANLVSTTNDGVNLIMAFRDGPHQNRVSVMKYNGTSWVNVGIPGFTTIEAMNIQICLDKFNTIYVAYQDGLAYPYAASVMKFNGTSWEQVGPTNFSAPDASFVDLAFNSQNVPFVVTRDGTLGGATVMKFNGTSWENVGNAGFTGVNASWEVLAFDVDTPYVGYSDETDSFRMNVMKYDGTNWVQVGPVNFSLPIAYHTNLKIYGGVPYVAYDGSGNTLASRPVVNKFDGTNWVHVGNSNFSLSNCAYTNLEIANNKAYVAYMDWSVGTRLTAWQIDLGTNVSTTDVNRKTIKLEISPNPTSGNILIKGTGAVPFTIRNSIGSIVASGSLKNENGFTYLTLLKQPGIYIIETPDSYYKVVVQE